MAADASYTHGLELAKLSPETIEKLKPWFPPWLSVKNPIDIWVPGLLHGYQKLYKLVLESFLADPNVDGIFCVIWSPKLEGLEAFNPVEIIRKASGEFKSKPILCWVFGPYKEIRITELEKDAKMVSYPTPERAMRAFANLWKYSQIVQRKSGKVKKFKVKREVVRNIIDEAKGNGNKIQGLNALKILDAYGINTVASRMVTSLKEALEWGERMGYPLVMKIVSPEILHKTDVGGVKIGITNKKELESSYREIINAVKNKKPKVKITGHLIQRMVMGGRELILGIKQDEQFGPVIAYGLGGIYTEILGNKSFGIAPLTRKEAEDMVTQSEAYPILGGIRGEKPSDISFLVDSIVRLSQLAIEFPEIKELDINPFKILEKGGVAIDCRILLT